MKWLDDSRQQERMGCHQQQAGIELEGGGGGREIRNGYSYRPLAHTVKLDSIQ